MLLLEHLEVKTFFKTGIFFVIIYENICLTVSIK